MPPPPPPPFRIFALPLTRSRSPNLPPLIYYHISQHPPAHSPSPGAPSTALTSPAFLAGFDPKQPASWPHWMTEKASGMWLGFSKGQREGGIWKTWQYRVWVGGEKLMDKIAFEEWALKNINTSHDPWGRPKSELEAGKTYSIEGEAEKPQLNEEGKKELEELPKIELIYPKSSTLPPFTPLPSLLTHLQSRTPYHRTYLLRSLAFAPVTFPFAIIPVIPNLPLFYVLWRAWSHWRAWKGGEMVLDLVESGKIEEVGNEELGKMMEDAQGEQAGVSDKAPDGTSTPKEMVGVRTEEVSGSVVGTRGEEALPKSEKVDVAPDSTATPASKIFHPSPSSTIAPSPDSIASTLTSSTPPSPLSTNTPPTTNSAKIASQILFPPSLIPKFAEQWSLSASEIVDLRRAVDQARLRLEKEAMEDKSK